MYGVYIMEEKVLNIDGIEVKCVFDNNSNNFENILLDAFNDYINENLDINLNNTKDEV